MEISRLRNEPATKRRYNASTFGKLAVNAEGVTAGLAVSSKGHPFAPRRFK